MKLKTATNREFDIGWIGVSTIDGALRFSIFGISVQTAFSVFTNPVESSLLVATIDGESKAFENFVVFKSIDVNVDGSIIVSLGRG